MVVGADGPRSRVRELLVKVPSGAVARRLPFTASYIQCRFSAERARFLRSFHPLYLAGVHPAGHFCFFGAQDMPDPDDPAGWLFFYYISAPLSLEAADRRERDSSSCSSSPSPSSPSAAAAEAGDGGGGGGERGGEGGEGRGEGEGGASWTNADRLSEIKRWAATFTDPWRSALEWTPDDHEVWTWTFSDWDPQEPRHAWDTCDGRVTLAGDAAHGMTVQRGQGLNHAVTDALHLRDAVVDVHEGRGVGRSAAVAGYEEEMKARNGEEVRLCTINTFTLHDWEKAMNSPVFKGMRRIE
jgi:2-polyprenyl-6-methoxyphenol hydroxylase-like FAD-dependent oxidoreductase